MKESFIFYRSFYEAVKELNSNEQASVYNAIGNYALNQKEDVLTGIPRAIFILIKPMIDKSSVARENQKGRTSPEYKEWRKKVFDSDSHRCRICGSKESLEAHHVIPFSINKELRTVVSNGKTLCTDCHVKAHINKACSHEGAREYP